MSHPPIASLKTSITAAAHRQLLLAAVGRFLEPPAGRRRRALTAMQQLQQAALNAARARQQQGQTEARLIAQHLDAYHALIARGFVGEENRLAWIEAVHLANRDARLYGLTYTLSPRTPRAGRPGWRPAAQADPHGGENALAGGNGSAAFY
jgi:hypothetical protein